MESSNYITINNYGNLRTVCPVGGESDPYIIYHIQPEMLGSSKLEALWQAWQTTPGFKEAQNEELLCDGERFEAFLYWLESDYGYKHFIVADAMYRFD